MAAEAPPKARLQRLDSLASFDPALATLGLDSVVKIYNVSTPPNISMPWQVHRQSTSTSSGFVIAGKRILCNAHGIRYYSNVRIRKPGNPTKYVAKVISIGHECDLALLTVDVDEFWEGLESLEFGTVPQLQSEVVVIGYPTGGDNISVTKGIVSRVDITQYSHVGESLLAIQIDAAINAGNSGGPTMMGSNVVGVAFETLSDSENIGYIIPVPVIRHFLEDVERNGKYTGFCLAGPIWQEIQNTSLKRYLGMVNEEKLEKHGVLVSLVPPLLECNKQLKKGDVITAFDGHEIADDGTVLYRRGERVSFVYLAHKKFVGETARLSVLRNHTEIVVDVIMEKRVDLVALHLYDTTPTYFIFSGLVFIPLSRHWLASEYGSEWPVKAPIALCDYALTGFQKQKHEEIVVLSQVLISDINFGYQSKTNLQVNRVNGIKILNVSHLAKVIEESKEEFLKIELGKFTTIVLDRTKACEEHQNILKANQISKDRNIPNIDERLTSVLDGTVNIT